MTDTEAVFEQLKHEIDRARRTGMTLSVAERKGQSPQLRTMIRVAEALGKSIEGIDGMR